MRPVTSAAIATALLCACAGPGESRRGPPPHPEVALAFEPTLEHDSQESLVAVLRALQQFHGRTPLSPARVAAATGTAYLVAAHEPSCAGWWSRGGRARGLVAAGPWLDLTFTPQAANPLSDAPFTTAQDFEVKRRNFFIEEHRPTILAELDAGRPVLVAGGWEGSRWAEWGLITRYDQADDVFRGWTPAVSDEVTLTEPPEVVILARPAEPVEADDLAWARHGLATAALARAGRLPALPSASTEWRFGPAALDIWRARLGAQPFCRLCGRGSWQCHRKAAQDVSRSLTRAREFLAAVAPSLPPAAAELVPQLSAAYDAAIAALAHSCEESVEAKFQGQAGQRELAFAIAQLTRHLDTASQLEARLLDLLDEPPAAP